MQTETPETRLAWGRIAYPVAEAAELLGIGRTSLYALIEAGAIGTVTIGRRRLVPHADLVAYVEGLRASRTAA